SGPNYSTLSGLDWHVVQGRVPDRRCSGRARRPAGRTRRGKGKGGRTAALALPAPGPPDHGAKEALALISLPSTRVVTSRGTVRPGVRAATWKLIAQVPSGWLGAPVQVVSSRR